MTTTNVLRLDGTSGNYASTPNAGANNITSDIDLRAKVSFANWASPGAFVPIIGKWGAAGSRAYKLQVQTGPVLSLRISQDGTNTISTTPSDNFSGLVTNGQPKWIRATWNNTTNEAIYYTSDDGTSWTQLGSPATHSATGISSETVAVQVGADASSVMTGDVYYADIRSTIGGSPVAVFDPSTVTKLGTRNPTSFAASTGETWTMTGSNWDWAAV